ncbi:MAG: heavy-metal-associated domain-containing protein [Clostridiaceae bacterium]
MQTVHYNVNGMVFPESKTKLNNSLDKIQGVQEVAIDVARGTVEVEFNAPATADQIKNCIIHTGYNVK